MKTRLVIIGFFLAALSGGYAAILEVGTGGLTEETAIAISTEKKSPGWIDSSMITDFESTTISDEMGRLRLASDTLSHAEENREVIPFDPWLVPEEKLYKLVDAFPGDDILAHRVASLQFRSGRVEESIATLERAMALSPQSKQLQILYLGILVTEDQLEQAISFSASAVEQFPDSQNIRFNTACAYAKAGNTDEAIHHLGILVQTDWPDLITLFNDRDFDSIRAEPVFKNLQDSLAIHLLSGVFSIPVDPDTPPTI